MIIEKIEELENNINKIIELRAELESTTNLKLYSCSYLDDEKIKELLIKNHKVSKKFLKSYNIDTNDLFNIFCENQLDIFEEYIYENFNVKFSDLKRIDRTSLFYFLTKNLYNLDYDYNDLLRFLEENEIDLTENQVFKLEFKHLRRYAELKGDFDTFDYNLDIYLEDSKDLLNELINYKKAYECLQDFKENQVEYYIENLYYCYVKQEEYEYLEEIKEKYKKDVKKALLRNRIFLKGSVKKCI